MESVVSLCLARTHTQKELCMVLQVNLCSQQGLPGIEPACSGPEAVTDKGLPGMDCHPSGANE